MTTRKDDRLELRVTLRLLERLDDWRSRQTEVPTRSAAARQLLERQLSLEEKKTSRKK